MTLCCQENVDLQLEAEYRERLDRVHQAVKKRLDYHVAVADAQRQFQAEHMTNWIINEVNKSITPDLVSGGVKSLIRVTTASRSCL